MSSWDADLAVALWEQSGDEGALDQSLGPVPRQFRGNHGEKDSHRGWIGWWQDFDVTVCRTLFLSATVYAVYV